MNPNQLAQEYVRSGKIMQLATSVGNQPWICTVHYVVDENGDMYWLSMRGTRHSKAVGLNPKAVVTVVHDPIGKVAVQMSGEASEVSPDNLEHADRLYSSAYGHKPERLEEAQSGDSSLRAYYVFRPQTKTLFDLVSFPDDPEKTLE